MLLYKETQKREIHTMQNIEEISKLLNNLKSAKEINNFLLDILTKSEVETLSKRWCILKGLSEGKTQRAIAQDLGVSLCKVTRGSRILKDKNSIITKHFTKRGK